MDDSDNSRSNMQMIIVLVNYDMKLYLRWRPIIFIVCTCNGWSLFRYYYHSPTPQSKFQAFQITSDTSTSKLIPLLYLIWMWKKLFSSQIADTKDTGVGYLGHCRLPASFKISNHVISNQFHHPIWNCYLQKCSNSVPCSMLKVCIAFWYKYTSKIKWFRKPILLCIRKYTMRLTYSLRHVSIRR